MRGSLNANNVRRTGDSMTGRLLISTSNEPVLVLDDPNAANILRQEGTLASAVKYYLAYNPATDEFSFENGAAADKVGWTVATGSQVRGIVPLARMLAEELTATNAGAVTLTAADTQIAALASMNVVAGDRILIMGKFISTKGATAGNTGIFVNKSAGTATIQLYDNDTESRDALLAVPNAAVVRNQIACIVKVTGTGTLTLQLGGFSIGSNSTVAIGDGEIHALRLTGT